MEYSNQYKIKVEASCLYYTENDTTYFYPVNEFKVTLKKYFLEGKRSVGIEFRAFQMYMVVMEDHPCFSALLKGLGDEFGLGSMTMDRMLVSNVDVQLFYVARHNAKRVFDYMPGMPRVPLRGFPPVMNGCLVPYQAKKETLMNLLQRPVGEYITALCVFAWQGTEESYEILLQELKNKDYYKRRAALEYISMHPMWDNDSSLLRGLVLDKCEYTVLLALKLIEQYKNTDLDEEVMEAYWTWNNHVEIQEQCLQYFTRCNITREQIRNHKDKDVVVESTVLLIW